MVALLLILLSALSLAFVGTWATACASGVPTARRRSRAQPAGRRPNSTSSAS